MQIGNSSHSYSFPSIQNFDLLAKMHLSDAAILVSVTLRLK